MQWLGDCVKKATQSYCGKVAAQIIRSYFMKAGQHHKKYVVKTDHCQDTLYGNFQFLPFICCTVLLHTILLASNFHYFTYNRL